MSLITPIITAFRRPRSIWPLVAALHAQTVKPDRIWAWANDPTPDVAAALAGAGLDRIVTSSENTFFHARFAMAMTAPSEFVALFDDDSIPGPNWFANCLETMARTPGILGTAGIVLHDLDPCSGIRKNSDVHACSGIRKNSDVRACSSGIRKNSDVPGEYAGASYGDRTMHGWQWPSDETVEVDLVGQAWFLRREWLPYLFVSPPVTGTNGEDIELAARLWRLAGIRSYCPPHPAGDRSRWGSTRGMELGLDQVAASVANGNKHLAERDAIVKAEIAAGWVPLFARSGIRKNSGGPVADSPSRTTVAEFARIPESPIPLSPYPLISPPLPSSPPLTLVYGAAETTTVHAFDDHERVTSVTAPTGRTWRTLFVEPGSSATPEEQFQGGPYDAIDLNGILATRPDPLEFLRRARESLAPGGKLTATFENVRHHAVVASLLAGEWPPPCFPNPQSEIQSADRRISLSAQNPKSQPIRFHTRREVEKLLYRSGYTLIELAPEPCADLERWRAAGSPGSPGDVTIGPMRLAGLTQADAEEFHVERYNVVAVADAPRPAVAEFARIPAPDAGDTPRILEPSAKSAVRRIASSATSSTAQSLAPNAQRLTSIILVTRNALAFTQQCIASIRFLTDEDYEIIVVDNGSTDGTIEYLRSCPDVRLIENAENRGFPAAANQGVSASRGQYVLFLNNDVLVTTGWLRRMLDALEEQPGSGIRENSGAATNGQAANGAIANCEMDAAQCLTPDAPVAEFARIPESPAASTPRILEPSAKSAVRRIATPATSAVNPQSPRVGLVGPCSNFVSGSAASQAGLPRPGLPRRLGLGVWQTQRRPAPGGRSAGGLLPVGSPRGAR